MKANPIPALTLLLAACAGTPARPTTEHAEPAARAVAEAVVERMGGWEAWDSTRYLRWRFFGRREHWWDKATGDVRIDTGDVLLLMNLGTRQGRAWRDGVEVQDPDALAELLEQGYGWWVNDSYWMFMPYKLLDPGVHLRDLGAGSLADGRDARVLELTFDTVGLTPDNRYEVFVAADSGLVEQWSFYASATDEAPAFTGPWTDWRPFGDLWLAASRGRGADWYIAAPAELPRELFTSPDDVPEELQG
ncbi:MAG: hypothetical protein AAF682_24885 [Planctomycetota bacterium]